jgi:hypothetical protein
MDFPDMWFPRRSALFGGENFDEAMAVATMKLMTM